ncbi:hypothetical protein MUK42_31463 [Musa troglodytarum]|uniref:Uncharacterized protein n=1 Tax=Musa troglodytarum TaxID=320322 RepID=A0A9E7L3R4_9LILI|nr:hypothetical protein MUK42_31463 [Musa troglodytarum]
MSGGRTKKSFHLLMDLVISASRTESLQLNLFVVPKLSIERLDCLTEDVQLNYIQKLHLQNVASYAGCTYVAHVDFDISHDLNRFGVLFSTLDNYQVIVDA